MRSRMTSSVDDRRRIQRRDRTTRTRRSCAPGRDRCASACARARRVRHPASGAGALLDPRLDERQTRRLPLRRQIETWTAPTSRLRARRSRGRAADTAIRRDRRPENPQHVAVHLAVEQAGQDRLAQQRLPSIRSRSSTARASLPNIDPRHARIERGKQRRDVAELAAERVAVVLDIATSSSVSRRSMPASVAGPAPAARGRRATLARSAPSDRSRTHPLSGGYR